MLQSASSGQAGMPALASAASGFNRNHNPVC